MKDFSGEILRPFSPTIGKFKLSKKVINEINNYIDKIIEDEKLSKEYDHGGKLVGEVTQEIKLSEDFLKKGLLDELGSATSKYIYHSEGGKITTFNLISSWVVRQFKNEYNPIHWHGGHISGVSYLKLPKTFGKPIKKNDRNGSIEFIHGTKQFLSKSTTSFKPVVGELYIFPNYLMHTVYPFYGKGERRSVSFNAYVDKEIYNIDSNTIKK